MHGFQNYVAQLLSSRRRSAVKNICFRRLKVKVTLEDQMTKWSYIELVRDIICLLMHCYAPNIEEVEGSILVGACSSVHPPTRGWSGGAKVLGKLPVPGRPTTLITVGQGPTALAVGADGDCLDIFTLIYPFSSLSPSLWETARYRLKYCLKGPLNPKQSTNHPSTPPQPPIPQPQFFFCRFDFFAHSL